MRIPGFIDMLAQGLDADTICQRLGKCHNNTAVAKIPLLDVISPYETLQIKIDEDKKGIVLMRHSTKKVNKQH